jgi:hypothetical protein
MSDFASVSCLLEGLSHTFSLFSVAGVPLRAGGMWSGLYVIGSGVRLSTESHGGRHFSVSGVPLRAVGMWSSLHVVGTVADEFDLLLDPMGADTLYR